MNRREALAAVSALFGGAIIGSHAFLAGCAARDGERAATGALMLNAADEAMLDEVGETILPTTPDSPGARAAGVGAFMNLMVTDCYGPQDQQTFKAGLVRLNEAARTQYGADFVALSPEQRHTFLLTLEREARDYAATRTEGDPEVHYYSMIKQLTLLGYFTSEVGATQALRYVAIPGRYEPCIPYTQGEKAWA